MKKIYTLLLTGLMASAANAQVKGDFDEDGKVTVTDITELINIYLGGGTEGGGYKAIDLGLSVKWANCNVGATEPYEYGGYYSWGETVTKETFSWGNYSLTEDGGDTFTKYPKGNKYVLDQEDDAATAEWGGKWRMPTKEEQDELVEKCTWTWKSKGNTEYNGVAGCEVTGPNGNSIFLPAGGYKFMGTIFYEEGEYGHYWSASLNGKYFAHGLQFNANFHETNGYGYRYMGKLVRAVLSE